MNNKYIDLIQQTFSFPTDGFEVVGNNLLFNKIPIKELVHQFGTPFKLTYIPRIGEQIERARVFFQKAIEKHAYKQPYIFSYCTKSSHFAYVLEEILKHNAQIELSSAFDTDIVLNLYKQGKLAQDTYILCNGYKTPDYFAGIQRMIHAGLVNVIPILDCKSELRVYETFDVDVVNIGLRMATEEEPSFDLYTSRFGIRYSQLLDFYRYRIHKHPKIRLKMLHFFVYTGISDTTYYWSELHKYIKMYVQMKQLCSDLSMLNIGGGLPAKNTLEFEYNYEYMIDEIVGQLKSYCDRKRVEVPIIFSEFGSFTVAESAATIFKVLGTKRQNDREIWYIIDNSLMSTLPDMWAEKQRFIMLPVNKWNEEYQRVILGGLTCDNDDYYKIISEGEELFLPIIETDDVEPLYIGFFHTGAYQESLSGYGGVRHCLIPAPKHILANLNDQGELEYTVFAKEQRSSEVMQLLGYK